MGIVTAGLAALATLVGGVWCGWVLCGRPVEHGARRDLLVLGWVGWYVQALAVLLLGWLGLVSAAVLGLVVVAPLIGGFLQRERFGRFLAGAWADYRAALAGPGWARLVAGAVALWAALQLTAPVFHYDLLTYSFGQPAYWLAEGRIGPLGPDMFAYQAVPSRMHYLLSLSVAGGAMVSFLLLGWTLLAGLLMARALHLILPGGQQRRGWPLLALAALWSVPGVWDLLLLRKEDLATLWGGAALLVWLVAIRDRDSPTPVNTFDWVTLALVAAATAAAKPGVTAGYIAAVVAICWWRGNRTAAASFRTGVVLAVVAVAAVTPLAIHAWLGLGHPLAPTLPHLSRYDVATTRWHKAIDDAYPWQPQPLGQLLPYALGEFGRFYDLRRWNFGDNYGLLVLLGLPVALVAARRREMVAVWLLGMTAWFLTFHWPRFALVLLPLSLLLVVDRLRRICRQQLLAAGAIMLLVATAHAGFYTRLTVTGSQIFLPSVAAAFSSERDVAFVPPSVSVCEAANARLDPEQHRLLFVGETRVYPCRIPFDYWNANFRHPFERLEHGVAPEALWERHLQQRGITHLIYSPQVARKRMEWSPDMHARFERWLEQRSEPDPVIAGDRESTTMLFSLRD